MRSPERREHLRPTKQTTRQQVLPDTFGNWHVTGCDVDLQKPALSQEAGNANFGNASSLPAS